jgi:hypothetical protein
MKILLTVNQSKLFHIPSISSRPCASHHNLSSLSQTEEVLQKTTRKKKEIQAQVFFFIQKAKKKLVEYN